MSAVSSFYTSVINEVIDNLKSQFNEDGIDPAALNDLKELWEKKIKESGALDPPKHNQAPPATQFSALMQQNGAQGNMSSRMASVTNAGSRLIKPSGQGAMLPDQQGFTAARMTMPVFQVQTGNTYRGNQMVPSQLYRNSIYNFYNGNQTPASSTAAAANYDFMFQQWLKDNRSRQDPKTAPHNYRNSSVPVVINPNQHQGVTFLSQYHNIISNQNNQTTHIMSDNGVVNLRKNQTDGAAGDSSDEEGGDFVNVSEADPQSVRAPMSNLPATPMKRETVKREESEEDFDEHEIDVLNNSSVNPIKNNDSDDEEDEDDDNDDVEDAANEEAPLNSDDDISDDDPDKIFETDNVIVCQYDKVSRTRNKWKLNFVSGIANLYGKDTVFHKAVGEAEW